MSTIVIPLKPLRKNENARRDGKKNKERIHGQRPFVPAVNYAECRRKVLLSPLCEASSAC